MGNVCGKSSTDDAPPPRPAGTNTTAPAAPIQKPKPAAQKSGAGRALGGSEDTGNDPRAAAARAAEERAARAQSAPKGALGAKLDAQRKQTQAGTLADAAEQNRRTREADQAAQTRNWA